ncbi:transcriptional regulator GlxA family with amidase domain [Psychromicrobium silvestre]|uniref:Transcriptional regulator GlxA family with amidase domain n=1 Tax=Psychromicrobium silvestre TaxID=1645614 RepID=A0A7Y9S726_9MICC|nr:DJ-1/PfpI family protein [Psychromicrobium silvestre]NYE95824.1 transcriptional regulator GlxA family with amidase domain [Psychromicrobium silvestre]
MTAIAIPLMAEVHLLDVAGPAQVFGDAARLGADFSLHFVADGEAPLASAQGLPLAPATEWPELKPEDIILVPGGRAATLATAARLGEDSLGRLQNHYAVGGRVASVCSGAFSLGLAGLLDGRHCTTHHQLQNELALRFPQARVVSDVLFTEDEGILTSAGIASGIDLALHIVAQQEGPAMAARVARGMVMYTRRNGNAPQLSGILRHRAHLIDVVHLAQDLLDERFRERLQLAEIATAVGVSARTLSRAFGQAIGLTPLRYQQLLRLEEAQSLIQHGSTMQAAALAVGFDDGRMLRRLRARDAHDPRDTGVRSH